MEELLGFLRPEARPDLRARAAHYVLGLTGGAEGRQLLAARPDVVAALVALSGEPGGGAGGAAAAAASRAACLALVNLAAEPGARQGLREGLPALLGRLLDRRFPLAGQVCALLANLSREEASCRDLLAALLQRGGEEGEEAAAGLAPLLDALCTEGPDAASLHYLGPLLCNLSQLPEARELLLDRSRQVAEAKRGGLGLGETCGAVQERPLVRRAGEGPGSAALSVELLCPLLPACLLCTSKSVTSRCLVQRLLPYTQYAASAVRRGGVVGTLRNCCFEYKYHEWLLSEEVDLLPFLLLPLAGPEEFSEDEMERLPPDLQYLPPEKQREPDPDIRKMVLEAIMLLTATKPGRQLVREKGTYLILRELHKWEEDPGVLAACEKLIQVLIGDEPAAGMENLLEVEIPADVEEQLLRLDQEEQSKGPAACSEALQR